MYSGKRRLPGELTKNLDRFYFSIHNHSLATLVNTTAAGYTDAIALRVHSRQVLLLLPDHSSAALDDAAAAGSSEKDASINDPVDSAGSRVKIMIGCVRDIMIAG